MLCGKSVASYQKLHRCRDKIIPEKPTNWKGVRQEKRKKKEEKKKKKTSAGRLGGSGNDKYIYIYTLMEANVYT